MDENEAPTILLVEDEVIISMATMRKLEAFGYKAISASSGEKAVQRVLENPHISLILMDIDLGRGKSGPEAALEILRRRTVPIVFLTSHAEREMVEKVRGITRYGYLLKSCGDFVLRSSIEMAFELFESHKGLEKEKERYKTTLHSIGDAVAAFYMTSLNYRVGLGVNTVSNKVYINLWGGSGVDIIDGTTNLYAGTVDAGASYEKCGIAVSENYNRVYTANSTANTVSIIDGATNTVVKTATVGASPFGIAIME